MTNHERRSGASGQAANELESVLTAVWSSADEIADGELTDGWQFQQELGALESALDRALTLVRRLGGLAREARISPSAPLCRADFSVGAARSMPVFVGVAADLHLDT